MINEHRFMFPHAGWLTYDCLIFGTVSQYPQHLSRVPNSALSISERDLDPTEKLVMGLLASEECTFRSGTIFSLFLTTALPQALIQMQLSAQYVTKPPRPVPAFLTDTLPQCN